MRFTTVLSIKLLGVYIPQVFPHVQNILFDLDDTLLDHTGAARRASIEFAQLNNVTPDPKRWLEVEAKWYQAFERGEVGYLEQRAKRTREFLHKDLTEKEALTLYDDYLASYRRNWKPLAGAYSTLKTALETYRVGVFTNGGRDLQGSKLAACGLDIPNLELFTAPELGAAKPQLASYEKVAALLNTEPSNVLLIGDNLHNDVIAARAAGFEAIHMDPTGTSTDSYVITTLEELSF